MQLNKTPLASTMATAGREKLKKIIAALSAATVMLSPSIAQACLDDEEKPHNVRYFVNNQINAKNFAEHIANKIGDDLMGYVVVLRGRSGKLLAEIENGWAKTPCEAGGSVPFTKNTVTAWASVTKLVTAGIVLNKIHRFPSTRSLKEKFVDHLPDRWTVGSCDIENGCWDQAEIRHLLSHRAGFNSAVNVDFEDRFVSGETELLIGNRKYSNESFSIWHYLGSFFAGNKMAVAETAFDGDDNDYADYIFDETRHIWKSYFTKNVFNKIGASASCGDVDFDGNNHVLLYDGNMDETPGKKLDSVDTRNCASGGMVMSPNSMSKFLHALGNTNKIISPSFFKSAMQIDKPELMGFDGRSKVAKDVYLYHKNGKARAGRVAADVMYFTNGLTAVIVRNSRPPDDVGWSWGQLLRGAYEAGQVNAGAFAQPQP